ncbi:MAG: DNRLRE domain-containing protein [candidate division Zixibacteria bacterium]|nr:DNRLRE domain-containing protein [candidate division Zixibacteria bacterium]
MQCCSRSTKIGLLVLVSFLFLPGLTMQVHATTYRLLSVADADVSIKYPNTNDGGGIALLVGYDVNNGRLRSFLKFDLSVIPSGEAPYITDARLKIYNAGSNPNQSSYILLVSAAWDEYTITWNNQPSASVVLGQSTLLPGWSDIQVDAPNFYDIKNWVTGSQSNNGFEIRPITEYTTGIAELRSRQSSSFPETLVVVTTPPQNVTFSVISVPENGVYVFVTPSDADGKSGGYTPATFRYSQGASVRIAASNPALGRTFLGWWDVCNLLTMDQWIDISASQGATYVAEYTKDVPIVSCTPQCGYVSINWNTVTGATGYTLYRDGGTLGTFSPPYNDYSGGSHCYQVDAQYGCYYNSSKSSQSCCSPLPPPIPPVITGPASGCTNVQYCISWGAVAGATSYEIQENGGGWTDIGNVTQRCYTKASGGSYCYYVRAKNSCGQSNSSNQHCVTVDPVPLPPFITGPASGCTNVQYCISWGAVAGATSYEIQENGGGWTDIGNVTQRCYTKASGGSYCYYVLAKNSCGASNLSNQICVTIITIPANPNPGSMIPSSGAHGPVVLSFIWQCVSQASGYSLQIDTSASSFLHLWKDTTISSCSVQLTVPGGDLWWRVRSFNACGPSGWSGPNTYTDISDIYTGKLPEDFALFQNHPNPFNPATTIGFAVPQRSHVTVAVYNLLGAEIARLVDHEFSPGTYQVVWNGRSKDGQSVSTGIYLYRIVAGEFSETRKMLLLK